MKNALYPFLFIALIIFNSCNTSDKYRNDETTETIDCYEAETECLSLVKKNKDELRLIHGLLRCKSGCGSWNRDRNGSSNIYKIAKSAIENKSRPNYLCRYKQSATLNDVA